MSNSPMDKRPILAFGAHPDDIEFGCGGVVALETRKGRSVHFVVCSRGEAATNGTPKERIIEAEKAAALLGATVEFIELDGDTKLEVRAAHAVRLAAVIRRIRPEILFAPSPNENQHPDHWRLALLVRDAARFARFGGIEELKEAAPHSVGQLYFYALTQASAPREITPLLIDVSDPGIVRAWTASMEAHASQARTRNYVELQLTRARMTGATAGVSHAIPLYPNDPVVVASLEHLARGARAF